MVRDQCTRSLGLSCMRMGNHEYLVLRCGLCILLIVVSREVVRVGILVVVYG